MLRYLGEVEAAERLDSAVSAVIEEGRNVTYDLKPYAASEPPVGTSQVADAVMRKLAEPGSI